VIHLVLGTKAQLIKMVPIMVELQERGIPYNFIFTGQHQTDFHEILQEFGVKPPDAALASGGDVVTLPGMAAWFSRNMITLSSVSKDYFRNDRNGVVLIHGDTASTLMGAIMARSAGLQLAHVEAGLCSFNWLLPFPEELIRRIAFRLSHILFCPGQWAFENVRSMKNKTLVDIGSNTLLDSLRLALDRTEDPDHIPPHEPYALASIHRYENIFIDSVFERILHLVEIAAEKLKVLFILHPVTRTRLTKSNKLARLASHPNIELRPRYGYIHFINLLKHSEFLISDGGSNQEETFYLGMPCILMRRVTERLEGLGMNVVLSRYDEREFRSFLESYSSLRRPSLEFTSSPSKTIVSSLLRFA
jgi:UDP-N-acetylglucosamine 2-epimerase (non-hydrolysing)